MIDGKDLRKWFPQRPHLPSRREVLIAAAIGTTALLPARHAYSFLYGGFHGGYAAPSTARTFYVDASIGSDSNNGLSPTNSGGGVGPWQTIAHVNAQSFIGNDSVLFNAATTFSGAINLGSGNWSGSLAAPLTIGCYNGSEATINSGSAAGLTITNITGIIAENLILVGNGSGTADGVLFNNTTASTVLSGCRLIGVSASSYGGNGIFFNSTLHGGWSDVFVQNCSVDSCGNNGFDIKTQGFGDALGTYFNTNFSVTGCSFTNLPGSSAGGAFGAYPWSLKDSVIEHCFVGNTGTSFTAAGYGPVGLGCAFSDNITIRFCEVANVSNANNIDGEGFDFDQGVTNSTIEYCYAHDCFGPGFMIYYDTSQVAPNANNTIRYCIAQNNANNASNNVKSQIQVQASGTTVSNVNIYNNTCFIGFDNSPCLKIQSTGSVTGRVNNNIFYSGTVFNPSITVDAASSVVFDGNDYFVTGGAFSVAWHGTGYSNFATWKSASGQETVNGGFNVDPQLTSPGTAGTYNGYAPPQPTAYALQSGSPMKGVGLDLLSHFSINPGSIDYYGTAIPNGVGTGFNVGAYGHA